MKNIFCLLAAAATLLCGCNKPAISSQPPTPVEFTNSYKAELEQRMALIEVGYWVAKSERDGDRGSSLYAATNREVTEFQAMIYRQQHPRQK